MRPATKGQSCESSRQSIRRKKSWNARRGPIPRASIPRSDRARVAVGGAEERGGPRELPVRRRRLRGGGAAAADVALPLFDVPQAPRRGLRELRGGARRGLPRRARRAARRLL